MAQEVDNYSDLELSEEEGDEADKEFSHAAEHLKRLVTKLDSTQLLQLYAYYKQGTEGPCHTQRPRWFDAQGKAKWDAWSTLGELSSQEAKQLYVRRIRDLDPDYKGVTDNRVQTSSWAAVSTLAHKEEVGGTDVFELSRVGSAEGVQALLCAQPELAKARDDQGMCALHWAADRGNADVVRVLLAAETPVDVQDECGQTALHYAAACGHTDTVRMLLEHGAATQVCDNDNNTPLHLASDHPHLKDILTHN